MKRYLFSLVIAIISLLSLMTNLYTELSIALTVTLLIMILEKIGKGILLREIIAFFYAFSCLFMTMIGYHFYTYQNPLAKLWVRYMPVPESVYYPFAIPAIGLFCLAVTLPFPPNKDNETGEGAIKLINRIRGTLANNRKVGFTIMIIGELIAVLIPRLPGVLLYFGTLFYYGSFAGLLYVYFAPNFRNKTAVIAIFIGFIIMNAISAGMFTVVAYMSLTVFSFVFLGKKTSMFKKMAILVTAGFFLVVLQNTKQALRKEIWHREYSSSDKLSIFSDLFMENIQKGEDLFGKDAFFPFYTRANQGFNVGLTMRWIPAKKPFDYGGNIATSFASAFVPRFLWPDKPEAGGKFNMLYYTGFKLVGFSTNVGPLGEAYGSFGPFLGIVYMFLLGLFIRWVYVRFFRIANRVPLLVCWLPVMFFLIVSSAETDSLQIFNSLFKCAFFLWLLALALPKWFGIAPKQGRRPAPKHENPQGEYEIK